MNKTQCEILGISSGSAATGGFALVLKEMDGSRRLPIMIGAAEAQAIALELESIKPQRPMTHDLMKSIIENLGGSVNEIIIDELKENTFYAKIILEVSTLTYEVDARPSDAIALAVRTNSPIYVSDLVLDIAAFYPSDEQPPDNQNDEKDETSQSKEALIASLQNKLREALEKEEYERAAKIRDDIKKLTLNN